MDAIPVWTLTHNTFEDKLCQPMKQEFDQYLSKKSDVTAYHTEQAFVDRIKVGAQMMLEILKVGKDDWFRVHRKVYLPHDDFLETLRIRTQARNWDE